MPVACNSRLLWAWQLTVILKKMPSALSVGFNTRRCLSSEVRISPWQQVLLILLTFWCGAAVRRHKVFVISRLQPAQAHRHKARTPTCSLQNFSSFDLLHSAAVASVVPTGSVGHGFLLLRIPRSPRVDASWGQRVKGTARPMLVRYYTLARTQQQQYWHTDGVVRHWHESSAKAPTVEESTGPVPWRTRSMHSDIRHLSSVLQPAGACHS